MKIRLFVCLVHFGHSAGVVALIMSVIVSSGIDGALGSSINDAIREEVERRRACGDVLDLAGTRMAFLAR